MKAKDGPVFTNPRSAVITVPDPDNLPITSYSEVGGIVEFRSDSPHYPYFEIQFMHTEPDNDLGGQTFTGAHQSPVTIAMDRVGDYTYMVTYLTEEVYEYRKKCAALASETGQKHSASVTDPPPPPPPPPPPRLGPFYHESVPCKHCDP